MTSQLSWLDFSEHDQRRARELIQLFSQPESRDELGIGSVRDALSDLMFPGISVIQTRARYFLFIPWLFSIASAKGKRGDTLLAWVDRKQRSQIEALRAGKAVEGLIGRLAGTRVKILPSTIYWNALQRFHILNVHGAPEYVASLESAAPNDDPGLSELTDRLDVIWHRSMPPAPVGFADAERLTFDLTEHEADWLSERIQDSTAGTPLAWLAARNKYLQPDAFGPWDEPLLSSAPASCKSLIAHGEMFSLAMNGAALLYNLLLARRCSELGFEALASMADDYENDLQDWAEEVIARRAELRQWNRAEFWEMISRQNDRVSPLAQRFISSWCDFAIHGKPAKAANDAAIVRLVTERERQQKKSQARLINDRLLSQWGGASGTGRLVYRWDRVKVLLNDIAKGRRNART